MRPDQLPVQTASYPMDTQGFPHPGGSTGADESQNSTHLQLQLQSTSTSPYIFIACAFNYLLT
jgi:hypothetical protein